MPVHINLTVSDVERSVDFYQKWLNFGPEDRRFPDGTVFVRDSEGTDLALQLGEAPTDARESFHFGFRRDNADAVRALQTAMTDAGVPISEFDDWTDLVSVKFSDPDGYSVEVYWER